MPNWEDFAAPAAVFDAAEGEARVGFDDAVDENGAGVDLGGEGLGAIGVACPDAGAEAVAGLVGESDGVVGVVGADDGGDGAEGFFVERGHAGLDIGQDGRLVEETFSGWAFAAES